jgi:CheY-like chemotaxis protein
MHKKVLVLCAEAEARRVMCLWLNQAGFPTGEARDLEEASRHLRDFPGYGVIALGDPEEVNTQHLESLDVANWEGFIVVRGSVALLASDFPSRERLFSVQPTPIQVAADACRLMGKYI